jgi:hypothetical protein
MGWTAAMCLLPMVVLAEDLPPPVVAKVPNAELVGTGRLNFLFFDIYDASLYAPDGEYKPGEPFALKMTYLRDLDADTLVENTMEQFEKHGHTDKQRLIDWEKILRESTTAVSEGTEVTALKLPDGSSTFYRGGQVVTTVEDKAFNDAFFGLWLGNPPQVPQKLQDQLLGKAEPEQPRSLQKKK